MGISTLVITLFHAVLLTALLESFWSNNYSYILPVWQLFTTLTKIKLHLYSLIKIGLVVGV